MIEDLLALFVDLANEFGIPHRVTSVRRTRSEQNRLYQARRGKLGVLPAAAAGSSQHEYGFAFDVVALNKTRRREGWSDQQLLGYIGEALELTWGGRFRRRDPVHFQVFDPVSWSKMLRRA